MKSLKRAGQALTALALTMLVSVVGLFLAPVVLADSKGGEAVGVEWSHSPSDNKHRPHNGVALDTLKKNSNKPLRIKHVPAPKGNQKPCAEQLVFYPSNVDPKTQTWPPHVRRYTRWGSHAYKGTPIVYVFKKKNGHLIAKNAVFRKFVKNDKKIITDKEFKEKRKIVDAKKLEGGTLYIHHYNMVNGKFQPQNAKKNNIIGIWLMADIDYCK